MDAPYSVVKIFHKQPPEGKNMDNSGVFYIGFRKDSGICFRFPQKATVEDHKKLTLRDIFWNLQQTAVPAGPKNHHNPAALN